METTNYKGYTINTTMNGMQSVIWQNGQPVGGTFGGDSLVKAKSRIDSGRATLLNKIK